MKRFLAGLLVAVLVVAGVCTFNTLRLSAAHQAAPRGFLALDERAAAERLAGAVRIPTVSYAERDRIDPHALEQLQAYLQAQYPRVHQALTREVVNGHSLLY